MVKSKFWSLRVAVVFLGFAIGRMLVNHLGSLGVVDIGFMSTSRNLWLVPLVLFGCPLLALGLTTRAWKESLVVGAFLSFVVLFVAWPTVWEHRQSEGRDSQEEAITTRALTLAQERFRPIQPLRAEIISPFRCPGRGVRVTGDGLYLTADGRQIAAIRGSVLLLR